MSEALPEAEVFFVGAGQSDTREVGPEVVGGKAWGLLRLDRMGLAVPPGFILGTGWCRAWLDGKLGEAELKGLLAAQVRRLENVAGRTFGGARRPLLVSVRSGAPASMPGMLSTVLDVGLNELTLRGLLRLTGNPRLCWDCYRRLVQSYATTVLALEPEPFERRLAEAVAHQGLSSSRELDALTLRDVTRGLLELVDERTGRPMPADPMEQLARAVEAVFRSWLGPRAVAYRRMMGLDDRAGTAVTVQTMVFGNAGPTSGSGVGFTRDPATGRRELYVDFAVNGQGEDVVGGRAGGGGAPLELVLPAVAAEVARVAARLEQELGDMQDFEFTVERERLYLLQTRAGKRTPWAALQIAVDMVREGLIPPERALERLAGYDLATIARVRLAPGDELPVARAVPAGIGSAVGVAALDVARARELADGGATVILVREALETEDIAGLEVSAGILTAAGARTSHAAVVARQLGRVCLAGCAGLAVDRNARRFTLGGRSFGEGSELSLDGDRGLVYAGRLPVVHERPDELLAALEQIRASANPPPAGPPPREARSAATPSRKRRRRRPGPEKA